MKTVFVELRVRGVALDGPDGAPLVLLEDRQSGRRLGLPIGPFEASAILMELEGIAPPRPLAHDLLADFFREGGFALDGVILSGDVAEGAHARLVYRKGLARREKAVRPSDAIALALRLGAPITAEPPLVKAASAPFSPSRHERRKPRILFLEDWKERAVGA